MNKRQHKKAFFNKIFPTKLDDVKKVFNQQNLTTTEIYTNKVFLKRIKKTLKKSQKDFRKELYKYE